MVDEDTKGLLVDQTIEKVSFCAPDRSHERGFSYICRDGTTRRWMCHGFLASKDSGERLSHAVGCAFAVCLERKQRRDKECTVTMTFDVKNSTFTRTGSFRQQTMTERLTDPPSAAIAPQQKSSYNPFAIERPHATPSMLERQGSFRGFTQIGAHSPFKRQMSLRINDLPSNAERQKAFLDTNPPQRLAVSPIPEVSPQQADTVSEFCKELSQGLSLLTTKDTEDFLNFEKLANGIITMSTAGLTQNIPSPPKTVTSPINSVTPYRPLMTIANSSAPFGTAVPEDLPMVPSRYNSLVEVSSNYTATFNSIADSIAMRRTPSPSLNSKSGSMVTPPPSPQTVVQIKTVNPLPKADQWLTEIVKNTSPFPRRAPSFNPQSRSKSLVQGVEYDALHSNWSSTETKKPEIHSTNPFVSTQNTVQQSFQVQL